MARTARALELAHAYRGRVLADRARAVALIADAWPADGTGIGQWARYAAHVISYVQGRGISLTSAYVTAVKAAELAGISPAVAATLPAAGTTRGGVPLDQALADVVARNRRAASTAGHGEAEGLRMALRAAQRTAAHEVLAAPDQALTELLASDPLVRGWRRIASANACGACLAAANGQVHPAGEEIERHPHCRCVQEILLRGVPDLHRPPTGQQIFDAMSPAEQDALFRHRGGAAKAELIRSGNVPLSSLLTRAPRGPNRPDVISETPLRALAA